MASVDQAPEVLLPSHQKHFTFFFLSLLPPSFLSFPVNLLFLFFFSPLALPYSRVEQMALPDSR